MKYFLKKSALFLTTAPFIALSTAHAIHFSCVGAPQGIPSEKQGWFATATPETNPPDTLTGALCRNGGNINGVKKIFGNNFERGQASATYISQNLHLCQLSFNEEAGSYNLCGNRLESQFHLKFDPAQTTWTIARSILENSNRLPGIYQKNRADAWDNTLKQASALAHYHSLQLGETLNDLKNTNQIFLRKAVAPAIHEATIQNQTQEAKIAEWRTKLESVPSTKFSQQNHELNRAFRAIEKQPDHQGKNSRTTKWIDNLTHSSESGETRSTWAQLEMMEAVLNASTHSALTQSEVELIRKTHQDWIGTDGFILSHHIRAESREFSSSVIAQIGTPHTTDQGRKVRREINRGLLTLTDTQGDSQEKGLRREQTLGGLALAISADQAYQKGATADGDHLIRHSARMIDLALGFIPIAGSINDLTQIAFGMVTGYDYTGEKMTSADYVLRGAGFILGLAPFGGELKIGITSISESFFNGVRLIKGTGLQGVIARIIAKTPELTGTVTEGIGGLFKKTSIAGASADLHLIADELSVLAEHGNSEAVRLFSQTLKNAKINIDDRMRLIRSFVPNTIEMKLTNSTIDVFRWHHDGEGALLIARFVSPEKVLNSGLARRVFAIPAENKMLFLDRLQINAGSLIFEGIAAGVSDSLPGGARQIFITGKIHDSLTFIERLKIP